MYRADYAAGGFRMLPVVEPDGHTTGQLMMVYSFALIPVALLLTVGQVSGWVYGLGAVLLGLGMLVLAWRFNFERSDKRARAIFVASLAYLPALLTLMIWNASPAPSVYIQAQPDAASIAQLTGSVPANAAEQ
jgi:protoheme IX farnesyltransferase